MKVLVIGGTGPTGPHIVNGLLARGFEVTILNRGNHERPEIPASVTRLYADPYDRDSLVDAIAGRDFDLCISMYGRLRMIASEMSARVPRFISIGGAPAYRGYMNPLLYPDGGMPVPIPESADKVVHESEDSKGWRILRTEHAVFEAIPHATHFRYPIIYGPHQPVAREWSLVRRLRDGRTRLVLADGGLTLHSFGYAENVAHGVLLAVDKPAISAAKIYNVADIEVLTLAQVAHCIAAHMGVALEIIDMPLALARPALPLLMQPASTHRVQDVYAIRHDLGYTDTVAPRAALARTVDWLLANPPAPGGMEEQVLQDPFDYAAEDRLIAAWQDLLSRFPDIAWANEPGVGMAYSGPGGRPRSQVKFKE